MANKPLPRSILQCYALDANARIAEGTRMSTSNLCANPDCPYKVIIDENKVIHHGFVLCNSPDRHIFFEMGEQEQMHLECYIRHCVKKAIDELA